MTSKAIGWELSLSQVGWLCYFSPSHKALGSSQLMLLWLRLLLLLLLFLFFCSCCCCFQQKRVLSLTSALFGLKRQSAGRRWGALRGAEKRVITKGGLKGSSYPSSDDWIAIVSLEVWFWFDFASWIEGCEMWVCFFSFGVFGIWPGVPNWSTTNKFRISSDVETSKPGQRADNCQTVGSWDDTLFVPIFYPLNSE